MLWPCSRPQTEVNKKNIRKIKANINVQRNDY